MNAALMVVAQGERLAHLESLSSGGTIRRTAHVRYCHGSWFISSFINSS